MLQLLPHVALALLAQTPDAAPAALTDPPGRQDPQEPLAPSVDDQRLAQLEFLIGDGVVAVVGRQLVRRSDVLLALRQPEYERRVPGLAELVASRSESAQQEALNLVLVELVRDLLKTEGGRNQGYDPVLVDRLVDGSVRRWTRQVGGAVRATQIWRDNGFTPESFRTNREKLLLQRTWEDSVTGRAAGPTGRPSVDRFLRPGLVQSEYRARVESSSATERATVGIEPPRARLQQVVLGLLDYGSMEAAERVAAQVRVSVEADEITMEEAARTFTRPERFVDSWQLDDLTVGQLVAYSRQFYGDDSMAEAVLDLEPGQVTAPLVYMSETESGQRRPSALVVYRLAAQLPATPARPYADPLLQLDLREQLQDELDEIREEQALRELLEATYIYPPALKVQLLRGPGPAPQPGAGAAPGR